MYDDGHVDACFISSIRYQSSREFILPKYVGKGNVLPTLCYICLQLLNN